MRIDAHQHFWNVERLDYGWLTPNEKTLYRNYLPEDLLPILKEHQIERTIVVQAAPRVEETEFLLELYAKTDFIAGVVGWLDLESADFKEHYQRFRQKQGFVGIRPMLQDLEDKQWILQSQVLKNVEILVEDDFPLDILIYPHHLPYINQLLHQFPQLRAVINHAAKPYIAKGIRQPWQEQMSDIAAYENVMCKLSGMITEADHHHWKASDLLPYVGHVLDVFGTDAVMFGSDWPVCLLAGSYGDVYQALLDVLPNNVSSQERDALFGGNAARFYKL